MTGNTVLKYLKVSYGTAILLSTRCSKMSLCCTVKELQISAFQICASIISVSPKTILGPLTLRGTFIFSCYSLFANKLSPHASCCLAAYLCCWICWLHLDNFRVKDGSSSKYVTLKLLMAFPPGHTHHLSLNLCG